MVGNKTLNGGKKREEEGAEETCQSKILGRQVGTVLMYFISLNPYSTPEIKRYQNTQLCQ